MTPEAILIIVIITVASIYLLAKALFRQYFVEYYRAKALFLKEHFDVNNQAPPNGGSDGPDAG